MQVLLDGHPVATACPSLAEALAAATADAEKRGRIIVEVKADGVTLSDEKLGNPSSEPSTIGELRMLSAEPRALVRHTLLEGVTALENARAEQAKAAEQIQSGHTEQALNTLQVAVLTWQAVRDIVSRSAAVLALDLDTLELTGVDEDVNFKTATKDLLGHLTQMRTALDQQDWSALSDIVGYDLDAQAGVWKGLLIALSQHISNLPVGAPKAGRG
jgi:hypothetical protein